MSSRGLTLIEVVIVIAIIAILSALALPAIWNRLGDSRVNSAARQLEAAVISVRAQSQREGYAISLVASHDERGMLLKAERIEQPGSWLDEEMPIDRRSGDQREHGRDAGVPTARVIGRLAKGVTVAAGRISETEQGNDALPLRRHEIEQFPPVRIAVALPDGTVIVQPPVRLTAGSTQLRMHINRFTGASSVERERLQGEADQRSGQDRERTELNAASEVERR